MSRPYLHALCCGLEQCQVAALEALSETAPPGSEEWIQAGHLKISNMNSVKHPSTLPSILPSTLLGVEAATQLAAAREELRLLGFSAPRCDSLASSGFLHVPVTLVS